MSDRLNEFFARETMEYLSELEGLIGAPGTPDPDELLRLSTGVRGSAEMAEAEGIIVLAEALEDASRTLVAGEVGWTGDLENLVAATVRELRELVEALGHWGSTEDERLRRALERWDRARIDAHPDPSGTSAERVVPIGELFYDDAGPHIVEDDDEYDGEPIPITDLLFSGPAALQEILALRPRIEAAARGASSESLDALIAEVFDLVELGIGVDHPNEG